MCGPFPFFGRFPEVNLPFPLTFYLRVVCGRVPDLRGSQMFDFSCTACEYEYYVKEEKRMFSSGSAAICTEHTGVFTCDRVGGTGCHSIPSSWRSFCCRFNILRLYRCSCCCHRLSIAVHRSGLQLSTSCCQDHSCWTLKNCCNSSPSNKASGCCVQAPLLFNEDTREKEGNYTSIGQSHKHEEPRRHRRYRRFRCCGHE